jgi:hypothetical protein
MTQVAQAIRCRPILFSAPMVRAILGGRKTQTRRLRRLDHFNKSPDLWRLCTMMKDGCAATFHGPGPCRSITGIASPFGKRGDTLWVKETWRPRVVHHCGYPGGVCDCDDVTVEYAADRGTQIFRGEDIDSNWTIPKAAKRGNVSCLFMPRWASRITLEIQSVRVERVQEASVLDLVAEGVATKGNGAYWATDPATGKTINKDFREYWRQRWTDLHGAELWESNPWVWVISFKKKEVDAQ